MTRAAILPKTVALSLALAAHGALALALVATDPVTVEGSDGAGEVRLGNAFQDMAAGTLNAERVQDALLPEALTPDTADRLRPDRPEAARSVTAPEPAAIAEAPATAGRANAEPAARDDSAPMAPLVQPLPAQTLDASPPRALASGAPEAPATPAAEAPAERLQSEASVGAAVTRSLRPMPRSAEFVARHKPAAADPPRTATRAPAEAAPSPGTAQRNARAGVATGAAGAKARQSGNEGRQRTAGNAAVSNYPGLVMKRLSRAGKPRVNARGTALVAFTIGNGGGLAAVSLARSSGSAALDTAALRLVRRAGPFPRPPQGARRSFSIEIRGR